MRKAASFYFFKTKPIVPENRYEQWRRVADLLGLKAHERLRVEWIIFYYIVAKENATLTAQHFGISRKTCHKWLKRFEDSKYDVHSLADQPKAPRHKRKWEVTLVQAERIRCLREKYPHYGKRKLKVLYGKEYSEEISVLRQNKRLPKKLWLRHKSCYQSLMSFDPHLLGAGRSAKFHKCSKFSLICFRSVTGLRP